MKLDPTLRSAIKSKCKRQPSIDWTVKKKANDESIAEFLASKPKAAARVKAIREAKASLQNQIDLLQERYNKLGKEMCEKFGLSDSRGELDFARCDSSNEAFTKAGGKIPVLRNWDYDEMIARLASATPKEGAAILKEIGINWE